MTASAAIGATMLMPQLRLANAGPIPAGPFPALDDQGDMPWLGLATSLTEEHSYDCKVEGSIPSALRGTLYRNGPGLFDRSGTRKRSLLDGDGMVQAFAIGEGGVHYRNRFTRTEKYLEEEAAGQYVYATWTTRAPGGMFPNLFARAIRNQAGVSTIRHGERLYAFDESTAPYELDPDSLETVGLADLGAPEGSVVFSAHPKMDPVTGEWLHFGVSYGPSFTVHLSTIKADGGAGEYREFTLPRGNYVHDYFVTENYVLFNLHPAEFSMFAFLLGRSSLVKSMRWMPEKGNLIVVVPRRGAAEPVVIEADSAWMWHSLNAYERGDEIVADFVGYDSPNHFVGDDAFFFSMMEGRAGSWSPSSLRRYVIDLPGKKLKSETILADSHVEFPIVDPRRMCHAHRYGYVARGVSDDPFWTQIVRVDTETGAMDVHDFGEGRYCSEPIFAPEGSGARAGHQAAAEKGWLLTQVYDGHTRRSFLAILRADDVGGGPVAVAHMQHHVPISFHGNWSAG